MDALLEEPPKQCDQRNPESAKKKCNWEVFLIDLSALFSSAVIDRIRKSKDNEGSRTTYIQQENIVAALL